MLAFCIYHIVPLDFHPMLELALNPFVGETNIGVFYSDLLHRTQTCAAACVSGEEETILTERQCGLAVSYIDSLTNRRKLHLQSRCYYAVPC